MLSIGLIEAVKSHAANTKSAVKFQHVVKAKVVGYFHIATSSIHAHLPMVL